MPDEIIVASWRDITVSSLALTRLGPRRSSIFRPDFFSSSAMTLRPLALSSEVTVFLSAPSIIALLRDSREVDRLECEGGHQAAFAIMPAPSPGGISISLRSSSGLEERVTAISSVMRPARTRPASEASIVCIPCAAPVWISE